MPHLYSDYTMSLSLREPILEYLRSEHALVRVYTGTAARGCDLSAFNLRTLSCYKAVSVAVNDRKVEDFGVVDGLFGDLGEEGACLICGGFAKHIDMCVPFGDTRDNYCF